ncbi:MAG: PLP-dependent aminotransferase family protein [Candidatus Cybelea sp.]
MKEPIGVESLFPDRASGEPLVSQLVRRLRSAIESGFFAPETRLLPSRELSLRLCVSRNTVVSALEQLVAEGYLEARVGAGTFVTPMPHDARGRVAPGSRSLPQHASRLLPVKAALDAVGSSYGPLRVGAPALTSFPVRTWQRLARKNLVSVGASLDYGQSSGLIALREAIARHIAQFRGVLADPSRITIVEGAQGGLGLAAFVLAQRCDRIVLEDPCYQLARAIFTASGLVLRGVEVDDNGLRTSELPDAAALAYVTPSHQFPLGGTMPLARRAQLLDWARRVDAYVIEDDYDSEFDSHPIPALQSLDRDERVIYVGTFSKTLAPGMRLGYVVVPDHLASIFRFARALFSLGASAQLQATLAEFIAGGHFSRHVRRMTRVYERRRRILVEVLSRELPRSFAMGPAQKGLHVAIMARRDFDDVRFVNTMSDGERVLPLSQLCVQRADCKGLVVGFSAGSDHALARSASLLAGSLRRFLSR